MDGRRQGIGGRFAGRQDPVDHQILPGKTDVGEFFVGAGDLAQSGLLGACHQNQAGAPAIGQRIDGSLVLSTLLLQPGQRAKAGGIAFALVEEAAPGTRQLQQADGVSGRRGVKNDVLKAGGQRRVGE